MSVIRSPRLKWILRFMCISGLCGLVVASPSRMLAQPSLKVIGPTTPIAVYDQAQLTAVPTDSLHRRVPKATIKWSVRPYQTITITPDSSTRGQHATLTAVKPSPTQSTTIGSTTMTAVMPTYAIATWTLSNKRVFRDSVAVTTMRAKVTVVSVYFGFSLGTNGTVIGDSARTIKVGQTVCPYVVARDKKGIPITGLHPTLRIADTTIATFVSGVNCPDTSVAPVLAVSLPAPYRIGAIDVITEHLSHPWPMPNWTMTWRSSQ